MKQSRSLLLSSASRLSLEKDEELQSLPDEEPDSVWRNQLGQSAEQESVSVTHRAQLPVFFIELEDIGLENASNRLVVRTIQQVPL